MWYNYICSREGYVFTGMLLMISSVITDTKETFLCGIICWCTAGIMAHD